MGRVGINIRKENNNNTKLITPKPDPALLAVIPPSLYGLSEGSMPTQMSWPEIKYVTPMMRFVPKQNRSYILNRSFFIFLFVRFPPAVWRDATPPGSPVR